jgi:hypothetical protein
VSWHCGAPKFVTTKFDAVNVSEKTRPADPVLAVPEMETSNVALVLWSARSAPVWRS